MDELWEAKDYLQINKEIWNEFSEENIIFEESQTGPQEEPFLQEIPLDLNQFKKYQEKIQRLRKK